MKRLYEYLDMISQEDIHDYVEKMKYSNDMYTTLSKGIEDFKQLTPIYNDNVIFSLYNDMLFLQPDQDQPFLTRKEDHVFYSPLYFVEKMDMTQQFPLNSMNHQQALGAYVVVDKDYPFIHMILLIIDNLLNDVKSTIQNQINEMIRHLQEQFPQATISTVSVIASDHAPQEDQIQQMESQIIEKQMDMNQSFEQKTKEYYQSILYN